MTVLHSTYPIRILVVEDDSLFAAQLEGMLTDLSYSVIGPAHDAAGALLLLEQGSSPPNIAIIDIQLGQREPNGIDLAKMLLAHHSIPIIFLAAQEDIESFEQVRQMGPATYLVKPTAPAALQRAIEMAIANFAIKPALQTKNEVDASNEPPYIMPDTGPLLPKALFIKENGILVKVNLDDISWVMAEGKYCQIALGEGRVMQVRQPLLELSQHLPSGQFVQIQRSYLINANNIERIDPIHTIVQIDGHLLPIGLLYRNRLLERLHLL